LPRLNHTDNWYSHSLLRRKLPGVLRSEAGFANAETVEALLQSSNLHERIRGQVIWIHEAGLLGARSLARVAALAE
jgi:hypothetical protein